MNPFRQFGTLKQEPRAEIPSAALADGVASVRLYDPIDSWGGYWGVSAKEFAALLDALPEDTTEIRVLINSPGGEVFEGMAIVNLLRNHPAKTTAIVEGIAASSASFIAASCDELVMMKNSELFIHNAWTIAWGDAVDLRKVADDLEHACDNNIASIYADKSGGTVEHWLAEMDKDLFITAEEAVAAGLADRIEGVGDASAARARFDLSVFSSARPAAADLRNPKPPASEPVDNQKEDLVAHENLTAGLRERLGVTDAAASDETLLAALDAALEAPANTAPAMLPEGTTLIDTQVLAGLQSDAAAGREARDAQIAAARDAIVTTAVNEGRIAASSRDKWRAQLDIDEQGATELIASLAANKIPVAEIGHSDAEASEGDALYAAAWGKPATEKEA